MKKFFDNKDEKITERAFKQGMLVSALGVLLCIVALCSVTFAWFNVDVSSNSNNIQSSNCVVNVVVTNNGELVEPVEGSKYSLAKNKLYEITIEKQGTAQNAYCILTIGGVSYYTEQILPQNSDKIVFSLILTDEQAENVQVEFVTRWGLSSQSTRTFLNGRYYEINFGEAPPVNWIEVGAALAIVEAAETTESETTEAVTTEPETTEGTETTEPGETEGTETTEATTTEAATTEETTTEAVTTETETTEPETTAPETTEAEITADETTEPETTVAATTEVEITEAPTTEVSEDA